MSLIPGDLADAINAAIDAKDKDGNPISTTPEMNAIANAVVTTLQSSTFSHLPGTITGTAPAVPGPVLDLAASNGIAIVLPATWQAAMTIGIPTANPANILAEATTSTTYLSASINVVFDSGVITGLSTAVGPPSPAPGILTTLTANGGRITGLVGSDWANAVLPPGGDISLTSDIYSAIANYIMDNAECSYIPVSVVGTFPAISAPLVGGAGTGGIIL